MSSTGASAAPDDLRIIAGPTGAGKSAIAMHLAERHDAVIISADSRQVYRGFDIGTAKPSRAERELVRHEGIDVADPRERWSAARWAGAAAEWIDEALARGQPVIVVGGTGFWLHALVKPLADEPTMDPPRRLALQAELSQLDTPSLRRWVARLDPDLAGERQGRAQLLRAAEVALLSGTRLSDWHRAGAGKPRRRARWLIVDPQETLQRRIESRLDAMFASGWEDEVRALLEAVPADAPAWNACGYREIRALVEGGHARGTEAGTASAREATRHAVLVSTRQYAKRQRTWFRNQLDGEEALRLDPRAPSALEDAERWFGGTRHITRGGGAT
jgi:tRNA dimethylallyltransferase